MPSDSTIDERTVGMPRLPCWRELACRVHASQRLGPTPRCSRVPSRTHAPSRVPVTRHTPAARARLTSAVPSDAVPQLTGLLGHHDQKVLEHVCLAFARLVDDFAHSAAKLEMLAAHGLLPALLTLSHLGAELFGILRLFSTRASGICSMFGFQYLWRRRPVHDTRGSLVSVE